MLSFFYLLSMSQSPHLYVVGMISSCHLERHHHISLSGILSLLPFKYHGVLCILAFAAKSRDEWPFCVKIRSLFESCQAHLVHLIGRIELPSHWVSRLSLSTSTNVATTSQKCCREFTLDVERWEETNRWMHAHILSGISCH